VVAQVAVVVVVVVVAAAAAAVVVVVVVVAAAVVVVVGVFDTHLFHVCLKLKKIRSNNPIPAIDTN
jgi:hypothetical protein